MKRKLTPLDLGAKCRHCPYATRGQPTRYTLGEGPKDAVGIFIGESPGRDEVERGRPFVGATGQQLDESFLAVKLNRAKLFIVNSVACLPRLPKSEAEMRLAADLCRPALLAQLRDIENVDKLPVFCAGKWATYGLTGSIKGIKTHRGFIVPWKLRRTERINRVKLEKLKKKRNKQQQQSRKRKRQEET